MSLSLWHGLVVAGRHIEAGRSLMDYNIQNRSILQQTHQLLGGTRDGGEAEKRSMLRVAVSARDGSARSQTPPRRTGATLWAVARLSTEQHSEPPALATGSHRSTTPPRRTGERGPHDRSVDSTNVLRASASVQRGGKGAFAKVWMESDQSDLWVCDGLERTNVLAHVSLGDASTSKPKGTRKGYPNIFRLDLAAAAIKSGWADTKYIVAMESEQALEQWQAELAQYGGSATGEPEQDTEGEVRAAQPLQARRCRPSSPPQTGLEAERAQ